MIEAIFIDLDGVLVDWYSAACALFGVDPSTIQLEKQTVHDITLHLGITKKELWTRVDAAGEDFWADLKPFSWAGTLWAACVRVAPTYVLSSPSKSHHSTAGKHRWVKEYLKGTHDFIFTSHKSLLAAPGRVLIDDYRKHIQQWRDGGGIGVLFKQPWSQEGWPVEEIVRTVDSIRILNSSSRRDLYNHLGEPIYRPEALILEAHQGENMSSP